MQQLSDLPIACYYRFSKQEQDSPESRRSHIFQLEKAVEGLGRSFDEKWLFSDVGSGTKSKRVQFQKLLDTIKNQEISAVVGRTDRLARNAIDNAGLARLLEVSGVLFFDVLKGRFLDFSNPDDWADFHNQGVGNEKESRVISKRIKMRFEFNRATGKAHGGPSPHGYRRSAQGMWEPNEIPERPTTGAQATWNEALQMVQIFLEVGYLQGASWEIGDRLGVKITCNGLRRWLENPVIEGHTAALYSHVSGKRAPKTKMTNTHRALISSDERSAIDALIAKSKQRRGKSQKFRVYPLSGLLWCDRCGSPAHIVGQTNRVGKKASQAQIHCRARRLYKECSVSKSDRKGTPYDHAEKQVIKALMDRAIELTAIAMQPQEVHAVTPEIIALKLDIEKLEALDMPDLAPVIKRKRDELRNAIAMLNSDQSEEEMERQKLIELMKDSDVWRKASPQDKVIIFSEFVRKVRCAGLQVTVSLSV